jgi:hypothetical protein
LPCSGAQTLTGGELHKVGDGAAAGEEVVDADLRPVLARRQVMQDHVGVALAGDLPEAFERQPDVLLEDDVRVEDDVDLAAVERDRLEVRQHDLSAVGVGASPVPDADEPDRDEPGGEERVDLLGALGHP